MAAIGSVFLGDIQQRLHRIASASSASPPSSPSPGQSPSAMTNLLHIPPIHSVPSSTAAKTAPDADTLPGIRPVLSLELRLRWLEAILLGIRQDAKDRKGKDKVHALKSGESLLRVAEDIQTRLDAIVQSNDGLRRFMDHCQSRHLDIRTETNRTLREKKNAHVTDDQHAHLLTPAFALSGTLSAAAPSYENMSPSELDAFLTEMEPDIRAAERDMREIEILEKKGVTGAGKLLGGFVCTRDPLWSSSMMMAADYEALRPRLEALLKTHEEDLALAASLEKRMAALMERHSTQVCLESSARSLSCSLSRKNRWMRSPSCL
jgi:hypothetical protein